MTRKQGLAPHVQRAREAEAEAKVRGTRLEFFYCPDHEPGCYTRAQHDEHMSVLERVADPSTPTEDVERIARQLRWFPSSAVTAALLKRSDLSDTALTHLARPVATRSMPGRTPDLDAAVLDFLMRSSLPKPALKEFATHTHSATGEIVLAFLDQPRVDDLLAVTLMVNLRRSPDLKSIREAFSTAPRYVAVSLAMIDLQPEWTALGLLKAARTAVANFARDPEQGVETLEALANGWSGDVKELIATVNAIIV